MSDEPSNLPPTTTNQQDINTAGQRRINLIWELTQALIAIVVVGSTLLAAIYAYLHQFPKEIPTIFSFSFGTIVGFYFGRTNHAAVGGIGPKENERQDYKGR